MNFRMNNLVYLMVDRGNVRIIGAKPEGVTLDLETGMWQFENEVFKIGHDSRITFPPYMRSGIVGVYDKTKLQHLQSMLHADHEVRDDGSKHT